MTLRPQVVIEASSRSTIAASASWSRQKLCLVSHTGSKIVAASYSTWLFRVSWIGCLARGWAMTDTRLSIRLEFTGGKRIGPGKIAVLEAIRDTGSISEAARHLGMSYRRAWMLVDQINETLRESAVSTRQGGRRRSWTVLTPTGERVIELYHAIERLTRASARQEFRAIGKLVRQSGRARD
jgi:molybdate transport system regulatory protein